MMNILSIAQRLARGKSQNRTDRLLFLSSAGIVISTMVMLISLSVILGFKQQVASIAYSQTGHISLYPYGEAWTNSQKYIYAPQELVSYLEQQAEIVQVSPLLQDMALLKTKDNFRGIALYGIDSLRYNKFFSERINAGSMPNFSTYTTTQAPIVLPSAIAQGLDLQIGDKVHLYFLDGKIRIRPFLLVATYQSAGLSEMPALCPAQVLRKLKGQPLDYYNRIVLTAEDGYSSVSLAPVVMQRLSKQQVAPVLNYGMSTAEELMPDLFAWLSMLDSNVIFLIVVMLSIGSFTMISGVIIIILDKTNQIGILKALGASNALVRRLFTYVALRLILRSLFLGNLLSALILYVQKQYQILKLNPEDYYMDSVPVVFDGVVALALNAGVFLLLLAVVYGSTRMIARIRPAQTLKFE